MRKTFLLLALTLLLTSCKTGKYINKEVKPADLGEIKYFPPLSYINLIEKGNKMLLNDSLSLISKKLLDSVIKKNKYFKIAAKMHVDGEATICKVNCELNAVFIAIDKNHNLTGIKIPPTIDSIMKAKNQHFALATCATGFGRKKGNYGKQIAKSIGIGILTMGMLVPIPTKSSFSLYTIILDSQRNEVVFYSKSPVPVEQSPTDKHAIDDEYVKLYKGYIYE
jgi:hypothetical protein